MNNLVTSTEYDGAIGKIARVNGEAQVWEVGAALGTVPTSSLPEGAFVLVVEFEKLTTVRNFYNEVCPVMFVVLHEDKLFEMKISDLNIVYAPPTIHAKRT